MKNEIPYFVEVMDNYFPEDVFAELAKASPLEVLTKIYRYDDENARKITSVPMSVHGVFRDALGIMAGQETPKKSMPDLSFYGAGVFIMREGDFLKAHVDHAMHPHLRIARMYNLLVYLTECDGGELRLIGDDSEFKIKPKKNRGVLFQSYGNAVHAVEPVKSGVRVALSVYFYSEEFIPIRSNTKAVFL